MNSLLFFWVTGSAATLACWPSGSILERPTRMPPQRKKCYFVLFFSSSFFFFFFGFALSVSLPWKSRATGVPAWVVRLVPGLNVSCNLKKKNVKKYCISQGYNRDVDRKRSGHVLQTIRDTLGVSDSARSLSKQHLITKVGASLEATSRESEPARLRKHREVKKRG